MYTYLINKGRFIEEKQDEIGIAHLLEYLILESINEVINHEILNEIILNKIQKMIMKEYDRYKEETIIISNIDIAEVDKIIHDR